MARASAHARAALAGNPSDGYGGATLAVVVRDFVAEVEAERAAGRSVTPQSTLVTATVARFERELARDAPPTAVRLRTTIPRAVGLGGSSAIVIATVRALCELHRVRLHPDELASFALAVETEDLGIAAGLQDRVAQAYGGLTFMDFQAGIYEPLDPALLPPLFLAWNVGAAGHSGITHGDLRTRFERGDPVVLDAISELGELARGARTALLAGDERAFARCVDGSFDARRRMLALDDRHVAMIELARELGASANYTGSGGAIVGCCRDEAERAQVLAALERAGYRAVAPEVGSASSPEPTSGGLTRRAFVLDGGTALAAGALGSRAVGGAALGGTTARRTARRPARRPRVFPATPAQAEALRVLGRSTMRHPGSLPNAALPAGVDTLAEIEHVVVLMMENHSYDNLLGMLGRARGEHPRGDGFTLAADGLPSASNPYADGTPQRAFRMPTTCQFPGRPSQEWAQSHIQFAGGRNDGFVISESGPVAMGYWTGADLPFTYDLATQFPIGDRWFSSLLAQTDPNRRYLIAATSTGMTDDIGASIGGALPDVSYVLPSNGTIFDNLSAAGISWIDYYTSFPSGTTAELYPVFDTLPALAHAKPIAQFFTDAAAGTLPAFSLLDPDYDTQSQENPQNIVLGETFLARVVEAVGGSPAWRKTMLIVTYDEHGGYYDHVPPPAALAPDGLGPIVEPGESTYDGFARYGFRVPGVVVSPFAKRDYVSHVVHDHTSILALLERKWNLPAMTYRDANANDLTDFLDLGAMALGQPTFPELPPLAASGETPSSLACSSTGPGTVPPPPVPPASAGPPRVIARYLGRRPRHGLLIELRTADGTLTGVSAELYRGTHVVASAKVGRITSDGRRVVLHHRGHPIPAGRYVLVVRQGRKRLLRQTLRVG